MDKSLNLLNIVIVHSGYVDNTRDISSAIMETHSEKAYRKEHNSLYMPQA